MRPSFAASARFVPLLQFAEPLRSPPPYSCSRKAALRYQIVSSPARQELPHAVVRCLGSRAELRLRKRLGASASRRFANTRRAARLRGRNAVLRPARHFSTRAPPEISASPPSKTA